MCSVAKKYAKKYCSVDKKNAPGKKCSWQKMLLAKTASDDLYLFDEQTYLPEINGICSVKKRPGKVQKRCYWKKRTDIFENCLSDCFC